MKNKTILISLLFITSKIIAQLPNTDIWLLDIKANRDSIVLKNPVNITNRLGYDNQPSFSPDGKYILYTSIHEDKQADIYKYDLITKNISQFTKTATSEYSPTFMPDGKNISVVMIEADSTTQRLWKFPIRGGPPSLIMKDIDSIGYHCWITKDSLALVMITKSPTLEVVNVKTQKYKVLASNVGRCITSVSETLFYVQKKDSTKYYLSNYMKSIKDREKNYYSLPNEDYAILLSFQPIYFTGVKSKIMASSPFKNTDKVILALSNKGIKNITRIAISSDGTKMAIVAESK